MATYLVDYGMTESERLRAPRQYPSKRAAMHSAAEMVRAYGRQGWAMVWSSEATQWGETIARWRNGRRS